MTTEKSDKNKSKRKLFFIFSVFFTPLSNISYFYRRFECAYKRTYITWTHLQLYFGTRNSLSYKGLTMSYLFIYSFIKIRKIALRSLKTKKYWHLVWAKKDQELIKQLMESKNCDR